jgi:hypothetical protein
LSSDRKIFPVSKTSVTPQIHEALFVERDLSTQITLYRIVSVHDFSDRKNLSLI